MLASHLRDGRRRHLAWLLAVVLLLPIAQTAATWHVLSFACANQGDAHGKPSPHPARCDFCLMAAGLTGGAAAGEPPAVPPPLSLHEAPPAAAGRIVAAWAGWAYRSRAPPIAPY